MTELDRARTILRTEITARSPSGAPTIISYGFDLTPASIFVVTDWNPDIDTPVTVRVSFPGVLGPIELAARVSELRLAGAPGEPTGVRLAFDRADDRLAALLDWLATTPPATTANPYRVLLVEDNSLIRDMFTFGVARYFERAAVVVEHAEDAERAWQRLAETTYDVVIVDYFLPTEDGASLISRMRGDPRLARLPVLAISVGGRDAREATISAGADLFIDKPLVFRDVFNTLAILVRRCRELFAEVPG